MIKVTCNFDKANKNRKFEAVNHKKTKEVKKILFPTEFSSHAPMVFHYALELAEKLQAKVIAFHGFGKPQHPLEGHKSWEERTAEVMKTLNNFVEKHKPAQYAGISVECRTEINFPGEAILKIALEEEVDLIVMGMTGKTNSLETLFGSTTLSILGKADCPVLAIPATTKFKPFEHIVYATNFEFRDLEAICVLRQWAELFHAKISCMHVVEKDENELSVMRSMDILRNTFKDNKVISFDIVKGKLEEGIEKYIRDKKADLFALLSHKRSFVSRMIEGSTAIGVARTIQIPLLVLKDNAYEMPKPMDWGSVISIG
jgi:nucleotide-binding universal stress UspA family protein